MCGITGGWWPQGSPDSALRVSTALDRLRHRGPNDRGHEIYPLGFGELHLGHTRLSILDLSPAGHQPMASYDGRLSIVYNGEIYNYKEIRAELQQQGFRFTTQTDTEVLLNAWLCWGPACLPKLEGMFAFALYDKQDHSLTLVRDPFGIKPLFYYHHDNQLLFGSEQTAMLALVPQKPELNWQRCYDYLVHGQYDNQEDTFLAGIRHLLPGHLLRISLQQPANAEPHQWWAPTLLKKEKLTFDQAVEAVREQFLHNIRTHLRSDVPVGAALSGGIDSSAIVCGMRYLYKDLPIHTFSYVSSDPATSEEKWIDLINQHTGAIAHKVHIQPHELAEDLNTLVKAQGEPFGSTSIYAQFRVFKLAREQNITVMLEGQGGDELLGGYSGYPGHRLLSLLEQHRYGTAHDFAKHWAKLNRLSYRHALMHLAHITLPPKVYALARRLTGRSFEPDWLNIDLLKEAGVKLCDYRPPLSPDYKGQRLIEKLAHSLQSYGLPHLLRHGDRNAMHFSVESRVPFLTAPLANLCLNFPEEYLVSPQAKTKHVFHAAMQGIVPKTILERTDKVGFATPEQKWLQHIASATTSKQIKQRRTLDFINRPELEKHYRATAKTKKGADWQHWRGVNFARWVNTYDIV